MQPPEASTLPVSRSKPSPRSIINVMIVDDSLIVRTAFARMISSDRALKLSATASSAEAALVKLSEHKIDVILLDLEMPGMGGMKALPQLLAASNGAEILVVSSLTGEGAKHTVKALSMGAADTMLKPRPGGFDEAYRLTLLGKIRALGPANLQPEQAKEKSERSALCMAMAALKTRPEIIAFGASTGGIHAFNVVLSQLSPECDLPIVITQHLPTQFVPIFAQQIENTSGRPTVVATDGTKIRPHQITIANGDWHLEFTRNANGVCAKMSEHAVTSGCLPSVDPMLASLARLYGPGALAVILSGMGRDGVIGARELADAGGTIIAQDADSSAVWGMPGAVANAGLASACLPPPAIAQFINKAVTSASAGRQ